MSFWLPWMSQQFQLPLIFSCTFGSTDRLKLKAIVFWALSINRFLLCTLSFYFVSAFILRLSIYIKQFVFSIATLRVIDLEIRLYLLLSLLSWLGFFITHKVDKFTIRPVVFAVIAQFCQHSIRLLLRNQPQLRCLKLISFFIGSAFQSLTILLVNISPIWKAHFLLLSLILTFINFVAYDRVFAVFTPGYFTQLKLLDSIFQWLDVQSVVLVKDLYIEWVVRVLLFLFDHGQTVNWFWLWLCRVQFARLGLTHRF